MVPPQVHVLGHVGLVVDEPAPRGATVEAERRPVAEHVAALLPEPVGCLAHGRTVEEDGCVFAWLSTCSKRL